MQNEILVTPPKPPQAHREPTLDIRAPEPNLGILDDHLEIRIQELEHKVQVLVLAGEHVDQSDDVLMPQFLQELDLTDCIHRDPVYHRGEFDLLYGDREAGGFDVAEVDHSVGPFSDFAICGSGGMLGLVCKQEEGVEGEEGAPFVYFFFVSSFICWANSPPLGAGAGVLSEVVICELFMEKWKVPGLARLQAVGPRSVCVDIFG